MSSHAASLAAEPWVALSHLDDLWFQVGGTLCNLTCRHCFIACSPHNRSLAFLSLAEVCAALEQSRPLGVKEYYFTGGEPFLNPDLVPILCQTLRHGPATVLTNGTVLKDAWLAELAAAEAASTYTLEFRVSLDGCDAATNDPLRGEGTFDRILRGIRKFVAHGFLPVVTAARTWPEADEERVVGQFVSVLRAAGYPRPRLKILPTLKLGAEVQRTGGYLEQERVTAEMLAGFDTRQLVCEHSRIVTSRGVYVCPILVETAGARLGDTLASALGPFAIRHGACSTCYQHGAICSGAAQTVRSE